MTYCNVTLVGNIGRDPQLRFTPSGMAVCDFSLATNRRWTDRQTNEKKEEVTWWKVSVWGTQAETVSQYARKGSQIMVIGDRVKADTYVGQDGQTRVNLELTAREVRFLGSGAGGGQGAQASGGGYHDEPGGYGGPTEVDDIPF